MPGQSLPPYIKSVYPAPGATGVARNTVILLSMDRSAGVFCDALTLTPQGGAAGYVSAVMGDADESLAERYFTPPQALLPATAYTASFRCGTQTWSSGFTTAATSDTEGPRLVSVSPDPLSREASPFGPFLLRFDKPLLKAGNTLSVTTADGYAVGTPRYQLTADRQGIEVRQSLTYNVPAVIRVGYEPAAVRDLNNNPAAGGASYTRFLTFLVTDTSGPQVLGTYPEAGESGVPINSVIQVLLDRAVNAASIQKGGLVLEAHGANVPLRAEVSGSLVVLKDVTLLPNTTYRLRVTTGLLDSNGIAASQETSIEFTTSALSEPAPVAGVSFGPQGQSVPVNAPLVLRSPRRLPSFLPLLVKQNATGRPAGPGGLMPRIEAASLREDNRVLVIQPGENLPQWASLSYGVANLLDIAGMPLNAGWRFSTADQPDTEPPALVASTPSDGETGVALDGSFRFLLNEPVGLLTPAGAVRLTRGGQAVAGQFKFIPAYDSYSPALNAFEFVPGVALEPSTEYEIELAGIADIAGNVMPARRLRFQTAAEATPQPGFLRLLSTNLDMPVGATDPIELEYNQPLKPGATLATAVLFVTRSFESALVFPHPIRAETSGSTIRVIPLLPWPAKRDINLTVNSQSRWGAGSIYTAKFQVSSAGDTDRPEVISVSPAEGTPIAAGQAIQLTFSKPMLSASQSGGGLTVVQAGANLSPRITWSEDRTTAMIVPFPNNAQLVVSAQPLTLAVTAALVDLSGNAAKAMTARYPAIGQAWTPADLSVVQSWPAHNSINVDVRSPLTLYLSGPADEGRLNRSVWLVTPLGRAAGAWRLPAGGRLAVFRPEQPWPAGATISVIQTEAVLSLTYGLSFSTVPAPGAALSITRTTLRSPHPADAVIDVEFNQDLPAGPGPLQLQTGNFVKTPIAFDELRPRPNVLRLTPRTALPVGEYLYVTAKPGVTIKDWFGWLGPIGAALKPGAVQARYRSPLPSGTGVALNARISVVFTTGLNEVSVGNAKAELSTGGVALPCSLLHPAPSGRLTLVPLSMLPANATIDVALSGLEDRTGRPVPAVTWSFTTGDSIDVTPPRILYTNAASPMDPQTSVALTFDKPIDPAFSNGYNEWPASMNWSLSPDLRTLSVIPAQGWNRGEDQDLSYSVRDWSGNASSGETVRFRAGFDPDRVAPVLRAASIFDGQSGVPLNPVLSLLFNEPLEAEAVRSIRLTSGAGDVALRVKSTAGNRVRLAPAEYLLAPLTNYQMVIEGVRDAAGNTQAGRTVISFVTGETLDEPATTAKFDYDPARTPLTLRFSRPVDVTALPDAQSLLTAVDRRYGTGYAAAVIAADVTWSGDRTGVTITPRQALTAGTVYSISLADVTGSAGGPLTASAFSFTAGQEPDRIPARVTIQPADGAAGVPLNVEMLVRFSRAPSSLPAIRLYENDRLAAVSVNAGYRGFTSTTLFQLQRTLKPNQSYRIEVDGFRDEYDNDIAPSRVSFTTAGAMDQSALRLVSSSPAHEEAGVALDSPWTLNFSLPLSQVAFIPQGPQASRAMPFSSTYRIDGQRLIFTPTPAWPAAATISLYLQRTSGYGPATMFSWTGGTLFQSVSLSFRTAADNDATPPVLEAVEPPSGTTIPGGRATVSLRFSKPVQLPASGLQVFYGADKVSPYGVYSRDYRTVTYDLSPPANSRVTIAGSGDIRDNADNPLAPFVLEYPTGETAPSGRPTATLTEPAPYTAPATTKITVRFDRVMDADSVLASIRVTENGQNTAGRLEVQEGGRSYRFHPAAPFAAGARVKVFILGTAKDTNGLLFGGYNGPQSFTVAGSPGGSVDTALELSGRGFFRTAPADATLEFELSAELDPSTVDGDAVWLRQGSRLVPGEVSLRDGRIVQFRPGEPLQPGVDYALTAGSALRALDGRRFRGQDLFFRAVPAGEYAEVESATETEWEGRRAVRIRFTAPVSPLAAQGLSLDREGAPVAAESRRTTEAREFLLLPEGDAGAGPLHVNLGRVPEANGRLMPYRRVPVRRGERVQ